MQRAIAAMNDGTWKVESVCLNRWREIRQRTKRTEIANEI